MPGAPLPQHRRAALFTGVLVLTVQVAAAGLSFIQLSLLHLGTGGCSPACDDEALAGWGVAYQAWAGTLVVAGIAWLILARRRALPILPVPALTLGLTLLGWVITSAMVDDILQRGI